MSAQPPSLSHSSIPGAPIKTSRRIWSNHMTFRRIAANSLPAASAAAARARALALYREWLREVGSGRGGRQPEHLHRSRALS